MKILIVNHYYAAHGGGIESVVRQLLLAFREVAPQHRFTWAATSCDAPAELPGVTNLPMAGSNFVEKKYGIPLPLWSRRACKQLAASIKTHDAVWLHDTLYLGNIIAFLLAKRAGKPIFITQHVGDVPYQNPLLRGLVKLANRFVALPMLRHAFRTIFIAAQVQDFFAAQTGAWPQTPVLIPNGVHHSVFKPVSAERRAALRQKFGIGDRFTLLFVGRFVAKKGLPVLQKLARQMPEHLWLFAGRGPLDPAAWDQPNCRVVRDRSGAAIAELYQAADVLVLPSSGEGLPLVVQEAAACGLPILCAPESAAADPALPALLNTALVLPHDPVTTANLWQNSLSSLLANSAARQMQSLELANFARSQWSWPETARAYAALFETVPKRIAQSMDDDA